MFLQVMWRWILMLGVAYLVTYSTSHVIAQDSTSIRFATFNCSLNRGEAGELIEDLKTVDHPQARQVAAVLQTVRPDVVLLNEFDYDAGQEALKSFQKNYLEVSQGGCEPLKYSFSYTAPVNTGVDSGMDLNKDGTVGGPDDAFGFGRHPGQYGMVVLSKYPIAADQIRTFQKFLWADMSDSLWPRIPATGQPYYSDEIKSVFRLSSKSHWDVPIVVDGNSIHFLVCHPTPPVFDGDEDRNGARNHDEIRFWKDYIAPGAAEYIYDDAGNKGGLPADALFVIAGDLNADPLDGDQRDGAISQLLDSVHLQDPRPMSEGAKEAATIQGGHNAQHRGDPAFDTGDFNDRSVGNLRIDYLLPSRKLKVIQAGVFWPTADSPEAPLSKASDHHAVWVDLSISK